VKRRTLIGIGSLTVVLFVVGTLAWTAQRQAAGASANEIVLIAPTGARPSVEKLAPAIEAKAGAKINGTYAASGLIKKRVIDGDSFDVALLLMPIADALATGNLVENSMKPLASVPVALVAKKGAPKPDISTPEGLKQALLAAKSVSYPHGAAGALSAVMVDDALGKLGILEAILPKVKPGGAAAVAKGDVDYALVFQNEVNDPGVEIVGPLPAALSTPAPMVGLLSAHAKNPAAAKALLDYLASPAAKAVYKTMGMQPAS
jgi:molybdate transport system substrate-binding protein